ncbi:23S rRNA (uracil(1939)-C(5))-methyltransferase RlmD [Lysinibacillus telephonicus]|uniref:23S rRNA (Uracil(1939)-C(5))-methyltransferase RlmD n=2 Tax=Lysinibacillus telephonicus TaxID=1714840 RepID=A0A3S0HJK1_9BACI|nr:23S rRNA (uracil(1939)-C(5))-methyltransferase RlmD [Lysinibacillus telephonicus]RTQ93578.1 23S rRNA (uracil(1939)-C(5))-methyltransferase RlmD [Lysinibacillus telephonicus]
MSEKVTMEVGQKFPLTIKRLGINGEGVGFYKRNVVFVKGALPGEEVTVKVSKVQRNFAEADILNIRKASSNRQEPLCPIYNECGGCQLQHLTYEGQLKEKRDMVVQSLEKYVKSIAETVEIRPTLGMDNPWHYRNKSSFQVRKEGKRVYAGLFAEGTNKLLNINDCAVQHPLTSKITVGTRKILQKLNISIYDGKSLDGLVRTIVVRTGIKTGETQVCLVTTRKDLPHKEELIERMLKIDPSIVSITQNINREKTSLIFGDETIVLYGKETIHEKLGELAFDLSSRAFFQLNPEQTVHLYDEIKKAAALTGKEKVVDAYCGVGTIGLWLAPLAKEVRGMDVVPESIEDAKKNARNHGFKHARYYTGTAEEWLAKWKREGFIPDVVTVDPPRTGLAPSFIKTVMKIKPKRFVYTSCNPSTFAKDLQELTKLYKVEYIQPVDMFPQTARVEIVAKLTLKKNTTK